MNNRVVAGSKPHEWIPLAAVAGVSAGFYLLMLHISGQNEAWDDDNYNLFLLLATAIAGSLFNPPRPWLAGVAFSAVQLLTAYMLDPGSVIAFLAMGTVTFCITAPYAIGGMYLGWFLRQRTTEHSEIIRDRPMKPASALLDWALYIGFLALAGAAGVIVHWLQSKIPRSRLEIEMVLPLLMELSVMLILVLVRPHQPWVTALVFCVAEYLSGSLAKLSEGQLQPGLLPFVVLPPAASFLVPMVGAYLGRALRAHITRLRSASLV